MSVLHLSAVLECDIFRKVDRVDYDSLHNRNKVVDLEMVAGHKNIDGANVAGAAVAVLGRLSRVKSKWKFGSGTFGLSQICWETWSMDPIC